MEMILTPYKRRVFISPAFRDATLGCLFGLQDDTEPIIIYHWPVGKFMLNSPNETDIVHEIIVQREITNIFRKNECVDLLVGDLFITLYLSIAERKYYQTYANNNHPTLHVHVTTSYFIQNC